MYPTKEQIINNLPKIKIEVLKTIEDWKHQDWSINKDFKAIHRLLTKLSKIYEKPCSITNETDHSHYNPETQTIALKDNSIISALHEFSHHIFGRSETQACRWSISIFSKCFPIAYSKLKWNGHMLIKDN